MSNNYYFAKLNINQNLFNSGNFNEIKKHKIPELILDFNKNKKNFYIENNNKKHIKWTLTDVGKFDNQFIEGHLTKIIKEESIKLSGANTKREPEDKIYISKFYYCVDKEILIFQSTQNINYKKFPKIFENILCQFGKVVIGKVEINLLIQVSKFTKEISQKTVRKFEINFVAPNNPRTVKSISDTLLDSQSEKATMNFENKDSGINMKDKNGKMQPFFNDLIGIIRKGWGKANAIVGDKNNHKKIYTNSYPMNKKIEDKNISNQLHKAVKNVEKERDETDKRKHR